MRHIFTLVLAAFAIVATAQELNVTTSDPRYPDRFSVKELVGLTYSEDGTKAHIELTNGAEYDMETSDMTNQSILSREASLFAKEYANIKLMKQFESLDEFEVGDIIGIIDTLDYDADTYIKTAYFYLYGMEAILQPIIEKNIKLFAFLNGCSYDQVRFHAVDLVYASVDDEGRKIALSERITFPYIQGGNYAISTIVLDNHFTVLANGYSPSKDFTSNLLSGMTSRGYMVVCPDGQGFGVSSRRSQFYVDVDNNPRYVADGVIAAKNYAEMAKTNDDYLNPNLTANATITNMGMSQGASNALGVTYYFENGLDSYRASKLPKIYESHLCDGAYDMKLSIDKIFEKDSLDYCVLVPLIISTACIAHPDFMVDSEGKQIKVHDYFIPELETRRWDTSFDGLPGENTLWQMLYSKATTNKPYIKALVGTYGVLDGSFMGGNLFLHNIMREGFLLPQENNRYKLNPESDLTKALYRYAERNILTDPNVWVPKSHIYLTHANDDELVDYANSTEFYNNMYSLMLENNKLLTLKTVKDANLGHFFICFSWIASELSGLPIDIFIELIKQKMAG